MGLIEMLIPLVMGYSGTVPSYIVRPYGLASCNCVTTARKLNPSLPYGLFSVRQKTRIVNSDTPVIGATMFTKEGGWTGHAETVIAVNTDTITTIGGNFKRCKITVRQLGKDDPKIIGYYIETNTEEQT